MRVVLNGEARDLPDGLTVKGLLAELKLEVTRVAVEVNTHVVKKALHATTPLRDGDAVEVVTFVGGG